MPSGAKKRKAAKKKKGSAHHHHHHPHSATDFHSHGDDDLKHRDDEKESDGEEVSSPASSQEHSNNHHQFNDGEKEEVEKTEIGYEEKKSFGGVKEDNEATERVIVEEQVVKIEPEVKPADVELNSKYTIVEDFEPQKNAHGGISLQSLDKESAVEIGKDTKPAGDEVSSKNGLIENVESIKEENDGVLLQSLHEGSIVQIETKSKPDTDELSSKAAFVENVETQKEATNEVLLESIDERTVVQTESDPKPTTYELNNTNAIAENVEPTKEANGVSMDQGSVSQIGAGWKTMNEPEIKNVTVVEPEIKNVTVDEPEAKKITAEHAEHLKGSTDGDLLQTQQEEPRVIDKTIMEVDIAQFVNSTEAVSSLSEAVKLPDEKINDNTSVSTDGNGEMKENGVIIQERNGNRGDEAIVKTDKIVATSDAKVSSSREVGEKLVASYNVPAIETSTGADSTHSTNYVEHLNGPEVPKSSDREPLLPSAPRVVQRTSFMGCCGLFEVFSRS